MKPNGLLSLREAIHNSFPTDVVEVIPDLTVVALEPEPLAEAVLSNMRLLLIPENCKTATNPAVGIPDRVTVMFVPAVFVFVAYQISESALGCVERLMAFFQVAPFSVTLVIVFPPILAVRTSA